MAFGSVEPNRKIDARAVQAELTKMEALLQRAGRGARYIQSRLRVAGDVIREIQRARFIQRCAFMPEPARDAKGAIVPRVNPAPCGGRLRRSGGLLTCAACGRVAKG